jgi:hypothetical protein
VVEHTAGSRDSYVLVVTLRQLVTSVKLIADSTRVKRCTVELYSSTEKVVSNLSKYVSPNLSVIPLSHPSIPSYSPPSWFKGFEMRPAYTVMHQEKCLLLARANCQ